MSYYEHSLLCALRFIGTLPEVFIRRWNLFYCATPYTVSILTAIFLFYRTFYTSLVHRKMYTFCLTINAYNQTSDKSKPKLYLP